MMLWTDVSRRWRLVAVALVGVLGCSQPPDDDQVAPGQSGPQVPVRGVVTLDGKPLAGAVVTFLPESGAPGLSDTDEEGKYSLETWGKPGLPAGNYKVAISYMLSPGGAPMRLATRSAIIQSADMMAAKEQLPAEYCDLGRTKIAAEVGPDGGTFDFDVRATNQVPNTEETPEKKPDAEGSESKVPAGSAPKEDAAPAAPEPGTQRG